MWLSIEGVVEEQLGKMEGQQSGCGSGFSKGMCVNRENRESRVYVWVGKTEMI